VTNIIPIAMSSGKIEWRDNTDRGPAPGFIPEHPSAGDAIGFVGIGAEYGAGIDGHH
jgi:hypothetical protein